MSGWAARRARRAPVQSARCPVLPGKRYVDWNLPDPAGRPVEEVRALRDDIQRRIEALADL
jgi:arsenate reductase